jgi:hypothetical protein
MLKLLTSVVIALVWLEVFIPVPINETVVELDVMTP